MALYSDKIKGTRVQEDEEERKCVDRSKCMSLKFEDKNGTTGTGKFIDREMIYSFFQKVGIEINMIDGFMETSRTTADITFKSRTMAIEWDEKLWNMKKEGNETLPAHRLHVPESVAIFVHRVPIPMEDHYVKDYFENNHGEISDILQLKDRYGIKNGIRRFFMKKRQLEDKPIKSYVKIKGYYTFVKYWNQVPTCRVCGETGHFKQNCTQNFNPKLVRYKNTEQKNPEVTVINDTQKHSEINNENNNNEEKMNTEREHEDQEEPKQQQTQSTPAVDYTEEKPAEENPSKPAFLQAGLFGNLSGISDSDEENITDGITPPTDSSKSIDKTDSSKSIDKTPTDSSKSIDKTIPYIAQPDHSTSQPPNKKKNRKGTSKSRSRSPKKKKTLSLKQANELLQQMGEEKYPSTRLQTSQNL
ncbi:uncharacterized protein LOC144425757 [Styela clava]